MSDKMHDSFALGEIADWQLQHGTSKVELPSVQRGFVWKAKQVEDLWDSLLRGFPIGSFLFSRAGQRLYLMDGQQRSTSIFLGHFNPFDQRNETKAWAIKGELPVLWIDLQPDAKPDSSRYLFRLITRSHPWGYQAGNNDSKLSLADRTKALALFQKHPENTKGYTSFRNTTVFPYDASFPIPLCFLIESSAVEDVIVKVDKYLPNYFSTKRGGFEDKASFLNSLRQELNGKLSEIFNEVKQTQAATIKSDIIEDRVLKEEANSDDPTLFVRINSAGTALTGDDLIYSIYKSTFPDAKNLIENIGINFISPPQVLTLVSRLVVADYEDYVFIKKLNVRDFQRRIKDDLFKSRLNRLIQDKTCEDLFDKAIRILSCKENSLFQGEMPPVIIKQFIKRHQDLFLFFISWLHFHNPATDEAIELKMVSKLFLFAWFGLSNVSRLWNEAIRRPDFWIEPINEIVWWDGEDGINFLLKPELLRSYYKQEEVITMFRDNSDEKWGLLRQGVGVDIISYYKSLKSTEVDDLTANVFFWKFIGKIQHTRQMVLFAQRDYINSSFGDYNQMDEIDDTNVPWDWDHIYPNSWVYNMKNCEQIIRAWNGTNGNFRAISLELNRSDGNSNSPMKRLEDAEFRELSFVFENDWEYWKEIDDRIWDKEKAVSHFKAITTRMINIYEKFWVDLKMDEVFQASQGVIGS